MARDDSRQLLVVAPIFHIEIDLNRGQMQPNDTERLNFRLVSPADAAALDTLNCAPGVMRFLDRTPPTIEHIREHSIPEMLRIAAEFPGFGQWIATVKTTGEFIGWFELEPNHPNQGDVEIGYRLLPDYWGQGLASEGASELLRYAFENLGAARVTAITMAVNTPSRKVMERIGLSHVRTFHEHFDDPLPGTEEGEVEYALTREQWLLRSAES